jgi:hypothetical protein
MKKQTNPEAAESNCCGALMNLYTADEGTNCYICAKCRMPCDAKQEKYDPCYDCQFENGEHSQACSKHVDKPAPFNPHAYNQHDEEVRRLYREEIINLIQSL